MSEVLYPFRFLLICLAGWMNSRQTRALDLRAALSLGVRIGLDEIRADEFHAMLALATGSHRLEPLANSANPSEATATLASFQVSWALSGAIRHEALGRRATSAI